MHCGHEKVLDGYVMSDFATGYTLESVENPLIRAPWPYALAPILLRTSCHPLFFLFFFSGSDDILFS